MKIKNLIIVSLILAVLTMGAVCASDNMTDDSLSMSDATEEAVEESQAEEIMSSGVDDDNLADLNEDDFVIFDEF